MTKENFGIDAELITMTNANGASVKISTLGAAVVSFAVLDKSGVMRDVVLGYDTPEAYLKNSGLYFGATVGRNANRISNASITIDGVEYPLEANSGSNNLHSGSNGISFKIWEIEEMDEALNRLVLKTASADKEQGFPGNMVIHAVFSLSEDNSLRIEFHAVSDKNTIANFTNHSYFNLAGHDSGDVLKQKLKIYAKAFTPLAPAGSIPTGEIRPVEGTPLDFTEWKEIGRDIEADYGQITYARGYDHNFVLDNDGSLALMAEAVCEETGIHLYAYTDRAGVQLYTGNFIHEHNGKGKASYGMRQGFCLESQSFPDACHIPAFENPLLLAGEEYKAVTVYKLTVDFE